MSLSPSVGSSGTWESNCEDLLDYLEQKQSRLPPHDFSLEYPYKTVRLQVERGDAHEHERVKALRIMFVELGDGDFVDCPIDLRQWLRSAQVEQRELVEREQQQQLLLRRHGPALEDEASPAGVRSAAGTKLIGHNVEHKLDAGVSLPPAGSSDMLLESPVHSDGSDNDDEDTAMSTSDPFSLSADSFPPAPASTAQRASKGHISRKVAKANSTAWIEPPRSALGAVASAGARPSQEQDAAQSSHLRKKDGRKRITSRRHHEDDAGHHHHHHQHHHRKRTGSGNSVVGADAGDTSSSPSPSSVPTGPLSATASRFSVRSWRCRLTLGD